MGENISENDLIIYPRLSKDYILSQISQETIFQRYLGIRVQYDELVRNPLREDNNPTCGFKWSGSKLRFKDFAGYFWGDCFDLVAYLYGLNSNNSRDFTKVLEIIARDFKIHKYGDPNSIISEDDFIKNLTIGEKKKQETINIRVIPRDFVYEDVKFWEQYKVLSHEIVQRDYNGFPTQEIFLDDKKVYQYGRYKTDICTSYYFGNLPNGMHIWKSYFPKRRKQRFLMNVPVIEGLQAPLIKTDITVITKSYKDVMCINEIVKKYKFSVKVVAIPTRKPRY
jgi:hypothetical protein